MRRAEIFFLLIAMLMSAAALAAGQVAPAKTTAKAAPVDSLMQKAQSLLQAGKYAEAFTLLEPREFERSGDVAFDYLLGISAVSSGKPDRATIALERVEALYPEYGDVRMYLGMAYYQTGDTARAKQAFAALLAQSKLAPQSKANADQYLAAIQQQEAVKQQEAEKAKQAFFVGNLDLGVGYDSNITTAASNNGSGQPASTGISGNFAQMNGNVEFRKPVFNAGTYGFVMADSTNRAYFAHGKMNAYTNVVKAGMNWAQGVHTYRVDASRRDYRQQGVVQDSNNNSAQNGVSADARFGLSTNDFLALNIQYSMPRFAAVASVPQDTNQITLGTNYMHIFPVAGSPVIYVALTQARDKAMHEIDPIAGSPVTAGIKTNYNRTTNTFIAYSQYTFVPSADVTAMWMTSRRNDSSAYARSATEALPKDEMIVTMLGVNWRPATNWTVKTQYMGLKNNSVVAGYAFKKNEFSVSVKREFK
ncbi:MAG: tetratricopeptide repeat protein [Sideroxydans sp.]|nr:tetratricopeptide repeat protein [Sideroxydans sp.]